MKGKDQTLVKELRNIADNLKNAIVYRQYAIEEWCNNLESRILLIRSRGIKGRIRISIPMPSVKEFYTDVDAYVLRYEKILKHARKYLKRFEKMQYQKMKADKVCNKFFKKLDSIDKDRGVLS